MINSCKFPGGRGFYVYVMNGTTDPSSIDLNSATVQRVDQSKWEATNWGSHAIQMVGFLLPVHTGPYKFCVKAAASASVYMSTDEDPSNKVIFLYVTHTGVFDLVTKWVRLVPNGTNLGFFQIRFQ